MTKSIAIVEQRKFRKPGFLIEPLGWVQDRLTNAIEVEPGLVDLLFGINQARMHLMALALAHLTCDITPELALLLLKGFRKPILQLSLGHHHSFGIDRALHHLPPKVLAPETYRKLVDLLNDSVVAKFLHHAPSITEPMITGLHNLPPILRSAPIIEIINHVGGMDRFADGLRILASRSNLPFDTLATQIGTLDQASQIIAEIKKIVESLPLPTTILPAEIGGFSRIDSVAKIRDLAKRWENCLASCLLGVNDGTAAIYLADHLEAVCYVCRYGRLGWFLQQTKGPNNIDIEPSKLVQIQDAFACVGIHKLSMIEAIRNINQIHKWLGNQEAFDDEDILDEFGLF
jgi:hypothetical protein